MCNDSSAAGLPSHPAAGNNQMYPGAATAAEIHNPVEDDGDAAYGEDDAVSDTTSVASTIWKHRFENGRRYHKYREDAYWGPNDDAQNDQLDIGDFADEHPSAEVIGTDLSPIQPAFVPPNVKFEWSDIFIGTAEKFGKTMRVIDKMKRWITDAGFQELKELGTWNMLYCYHGCGGWAMFLLTHVLGWKPEEVQVLVARFKQALKDKKTHAYYEMSVVYGKKPEA
ncbi:uncharacterized protein IWZ02DRAFT_493117 [Phyllosticta citriasiana]|uniref:uncharacterized protein n=1 Tax=Phyllosticta citriasiana TaxID=595635 RepID=UPI0030FDBE94